MPDPANAPILKPGHSFTSVTDEISQRILTGKPPRGWWLGFGLSVLLVIVFTGAVAYLFLFGVGVWGINLPVAWGLAIINMVWWAGIAHAGTLISALLLILRQEWRTSISRMTEATTIFAALTGAMFPILHLGRPWLFYYILPYPNTMGLWPEFRSPLVWDVFAILAHTLLPLMFFYIALIPDLATLRDRAVKRRNLVIFSLLSLGWRGSARHWGYYQTTYFILAALFVPLVVALHSVLAYTFAYTIVPGWHVSIYPPYFLASAILSGFAMILTVAILLRRFYGLEDFITLRHMDLMAKVILGSSLFLVYSYGMEIFTMWYGANEYELFVNQERVLGAFAPIFWAFVGLSILAPQIFWFRKIRANILILLLISIAINVGLWLKRYLILVSSLARDYLPSAWAGYTPTIWDWALLAGTLGLFVALLFLFIRFLPVISIFEMRELVEERESGGKKSDE